MAIQLVKNLENAAVCYRALNDSEDDFWLDYPGASEQVRALLLFGVSQYKPLALAAFRKLNADEAVRVLQDCVTLSFRFNVISRLGTHELEKRFNEAALGVESGSVTNAAGVRGLLANVYVDRLGNCALLEFGRNKGIGQKPFADKAGVLATSQYGLSKDVSGLGEWTSTMIIDRQKKLARMATAVWRFP